MEVNRHVFNLTKPLHSKRLHFTFPIFQVVVSFSELDFQWHLLHAGVPKPILSTKPRFDVKRTYASMRSFMEGWEWENLHKCYFVLFW